MSGIVPATISLSLKGGKVNFTSSYPVSREKKKLYVLATMWNRGTNKICFSSECQGSVLSGTKQIDLLPTITPPPSKEEKWKMHIENGVLNLNMECKWSTMVPQVSIRDVYCQFLIKIS